jgi:Sulfotransferase family
MSAALPNLVVIGVTSCGTTALHYYLDLHPQIGMSRPKELDFFIDGAEPEGRVSVSGRREEELVRSVPSNWSKGVDWYASHFSPADRVRGESSARYTAPWFTGVPERMASLLPDARLIMLVRDPIERMVSHYVMLRSEGREWRPVDEAFAQPDNLYLVRSRYFRQLRRFLEHFPRDRMLVLSQEDLLHRRTDTIRSAYDFLGVDSGFYSPRFERKRHRTGGKGWRYRIASRLISLPGARVVYRLPQEVKWGIEKAVNLSESREPDRPDIDHLREHLAEQLTDDVRQFRQLTGRDFSEWSI